ncbi:MAG: hypothetical protein UT02_C0026G0010, partial [Parcubacteria group bacterium GW2011_GWC2_38_7]
MRYGAQVLQFFFEPLGRREDQPSFFQGTVDRVNASGDEEPDESDEDHSETVHYGFLHFSLLGGWFWRWGVLHRRRGLGQRLEAGVVHDLQALVVTQDEDAQLHPHILVDEDVEEQVEGPVVHLRESRKFVAGE